jgi:LmbE family N-acetylglucosaminyl deacetylase
VARLFDEVPGSALAVYAHPDDPVVSCGGTLAAWGKAGCRIHVAVLTRGDKGTEDPTVDAEALAAVRAEETAAAGAVIGVAEQHLLGHPDGELEDAPPLRRELVELVRRVRPEVLVCPDPTALLFGSTYVNHRDHRVCGVLALDAVAPAAALPLYFPEAGPPHQVRAVLLSGTLEPDVFVDVSATLERKVEAVLCHRSQLKESPEWIRTAMRSRAAEAGHLVGVGAAEAFRLVSLGG